MPVALVPLCFFAECHLEGAAEREGQEAGMQVRRESHEGQTAWPREGCGLGAGAAGGVCLESQVLRRQRPYLIPVRPPALTLD